MMAQARFWRSELVAEVEPSFATDIDNSDTLRAWLLELTEHVGRRLRQHRLQGRTIHLKVRFADFHTITRVKSLPQPTDVTQEIWQTAGELLTEALPMRRRGVRLLGVGMSGFSHNALVQRTLFDNEAHQKQRQLDTVADDVLAKFGSTALSRGSSLRHDARHQPRPDQRDSS